MNLTIETITPEQAREMLGHNPANRKRRHTVVSQYAADMKAGRWQVNGDAIRFNYNGGLIDGQHRLAACVSSGVPLHTVVIRGLANNIRDTIDGGAKRSHADRLSMRGVANATQLSALCRIAMGLARGRPRDGQATDQMIDAFIDDHPNSHVSASRSQKCFPKMAGIVGAFHLIGMEAGLEDRADAMVEVWRHGAPDYEGCPMHFLRERQVRTRGTAAQMTPDNVLLSMCSAWPAFANCRPVKFIKPMKRFFVQGWTAA